MGPKPALVNTVYFTTEEFPEIIGFCEKDPHTHVSQDDEDSYEYKLHGKKIYVLKKKGNRWQFIEYANDQIRRVSTNIKLGAVLMQGLTFLQSVQDKQETRVNVLIPVDQKDEEKALALMYYIGGYPGNFLHKSPELQLILDRFIESNLTFLSYSYIPVEYLPWLNEELRKAGIIGQSPNRTMLMYKK